MTLANAQTVHRLLSGFYPDPTICAQPDGTLLMVNSSFEYFPGLPISRCLDADGRNWEHSSNILNRPSQFPYGESRLMGNNGGIYAPTLRYHDGIYYLIVTNVNVGNMILTSRNPLDESSWSDPLWLEDWPGIDPSLFFDDDGAVYICGNENGRDETAGIYIARIDIHTGKQLSGRTLICQGTGYTNPEGPHIYKREGCYYLMWAEGGTEQGHMENIARSYSITGPYEMCPHNPLITNRSTHLDIQSIGHCDCAFFDTQRTFMVFHGVRMTDDYPAQGWLGRETYGLWFTWTEQGWPDLSNQSYMCEPQQRWDAGTQVIRKAHWFTPGVDFSQSYQVEDNGTTLVVEASTTSSTMMMKDGPSFIAIRQPSMKCVFSAGVENDFLISGKICVSIYANENHYARLTISNNRADLFINNAGLESNKRLELIGIDSINSVIVEADDKGDTFALDTSHGLTQIGMIPGKIFSFTNAGGFTGTVFGLSAYGEGCTRFTNISCQ